MKIDLTCPTELWHCKMPTADDPALTMQVYNLSDKTANSIQVCVKCFDEAGEQFARIVERVQGLDAPAHHAFEISVEAEEGVQARDLEVLIEKVWFTDGTVWRRGTADPSEFRPSPLLQGQQLQVMQELAGRDAASYPSDQGSVWVCVCGRANAAHEEYCRRCHRDKHKIFTTLNEAAIEKIIFQRQSIQEEIQRREREEARRIAQEKEAREKKRRRRRKIILTSVISVTLAAALAYGVYFHGIPYYKYYMANRALESKQYDSAKEQFLALQDYRDSAELALECDYRAAMAALNGGTYTSLRAAQSGFDALGDYKDSATRSQEARYIYAEKLLAAKNWEQAIRLYEQVPSYADARMKRIQAEYDWAGELMGKKEYAAAREKYLALGDYQNSAVMAQECLYQPAGEALSAGDPLLAIEYYQQLGDYRESLMQLQASYYAAGEQYYDSQDYDTAAEYFLLAGDYADAYRRAAGCLYAPAVAAMAEGEYAKAAEMLEKIQGYQDSKTLLMECLYQQGLARMAEEDYEGAIAFFDQTPDLALAQEARKECLYLPALAELSQGDTENALQKLLLISGYKDTDDYVRGIMLERAQEKIDAQDYAAAIDLLSPYSADSAIAAALKEAQLGQAQAFIAEGKYQDAIDRLAGLDSDSQAAETLKEARYLLALELKEASDWETARDILRELGDYRDARAAYQGCVYALAAQLAQEEQWAEAAELFASIRTYQDALDQERACAYQAGEEAAEKGELSLAAAYFDQAGPYQDAAARAEAYADQFYSAAYQTAKLAMIREDYRAVVDVLEPLYQGYLSEKYADIPDMYREACYQYANALYANRQPFDALKYYKQILDYRDVSEKKLDRVVYRIMGKWESPKGAVMEFREDGTCTIDGEELFYYAGVYSLDTGDSPDNLSYTYNIVSNSQNSLTLRHERLNLLYRMTRVE